MVPDSRAPLVGREVETAVLDEALYLVEKQGQTQIVTLIGPAGIGKSRLIQDFVSKQRSAGSTLMTKVYRGSARDIAASYGIFARMLRGRFGLVEGMPAADSKQQIRAQVAKILDDRKVGDVIYYLGQFLGLDFEESPLTRAVSDDPQQGELLRRVVFKAFLEADAAHSPLCLVFEDLHHSHDDSLALLRYLLEYLSGPILVLCAARPELTLRHEDWARVGERRHQVLDLHALRDADAAAMMTALLAPCAGGAPQPLIEAACTFACGNPLMLEQMVRIYHDKGVLEEESELSENPRWRVDLDKLSTARLPLTIEDAVSARLAALEPAEKQLLEHAAAIGSVFWSAAFVTLLRIGRDAPELWSPETDQDASRIAATLSDLVERDYILKLPDSTFPGSDEYIFKHNKERETIQKRTSSTLLRGYHEVIADWMDHQDTVRTSEEYIAMLAEHREKGGDARRAGLAYLEAGDVARRRYANAKASEYYQKGLTLIGDGMVSRRIDALHDYGDVLQLCGRIDDALAAFREMLTLAHRLDLRTKGGAAHNRIGRLHRDIGSLDEAGRHLVTGQALFEAANDERGLASSIDDIGKLHWLKGEYPQALVALRDALTRRRRLGDRRSIALSLNNMGIVLQDSGEFKQALEAFEQSLTIRREIGDLLGVVTTLNNLGTVAQDQRDFPRALALFEEALAVAHQIADRNRVALVLTNVGEAHYRTGHPEKAIEVLKQAEELCDDLGDKLGLAEALRGLGKAYMLHGDLAKARDCIGRAVDLFASVRSKVHLGVALRTLGEITAAGGWGAVHTKSAREYFARSVAICEQTGNEVELARTFKVYARFLASEKEYSGDEAARKDAEQMNVRADAIFSRLKISSIGIEPGPFYEREEHAPSKRLPLSSRPPLSSRAPLSSSHPISASQPSTKLQPVSARMGSEPTLPAFVLAPLPVSTRTPTSTKTPTSTSTPALGTPASGPQPLSGPEPPSGSARRSKRKPT
jgi:tetratricopeptide (TPR) repeat protein